jgi:GNAT superfamily N-acetyltransferase
MNTPFRNYSHTADYRLVSEFLIAHHQPGNQDGNWLEPMWEYMHGHPNLDSASLEKIGLWEEAGEIVGVAHYESRLGEAFFQFHPAFRRLREEMLEYAEANLAGNSSQDERKYLCAYVNDNDAEFIALVKDHGYERDPDGDRPMTKFDIPNPFPPIKLPEGFRLTSLAEDCDWVKVHRVMWRGFDHGNDVPMSEEEFESRRKMFDTPKARRDLKIAVQAPDGNFAAFCGMFYEPSGRFAYVEPVATDPDYRRMGLGKAAVLEGIRRCGALGAAVAYVGNDLPIYQAIGFKKVYGSECWKKYFSG